MPRPVDSTRFAGREPERLSIAEMREVNGMWAAFELYSPEINPPHRIVTLAESPAACAAKLRALGLDPGLYEFRLQRSPL